jgi:hypothetical protein
MKRKVTQTKPTDPEFAPELEWRKAITKSPSPQQERSIPDDLYDAAYAVTHKDSLRRDRNLAPGKKQWQAIRRRYSWHLRESSFDRSHWWKGKPKSDIKPVAALYELARRHPLIGVTPLRQRPQYGAAEYLRMPPLSQLSAGEQLLRMTRTVLEPKLSLRYTILHRSKSWPKLTPSERTEWTSSIGKIKSFDFRTEESVCRDLTSLALEIVRKHREAESLFNPPVGIFGSLPGALTDEEWKEAMAEAAVQAHHEGYVLLAVAPDLAADKLQSAVAKKYREHLRLYPAPKADEASVIAHSLYSSLEDDIISRRNNPPTERAVKSNQRSRYQDWLRLISEFEDDELLRGGAKNQVFARYRRAVEQIRFA